MNVREQFNNMRNEIKKDLGLQRNLFERACSIFIKKLDGISTKEEIKEFDDIMNIQLPKVQKATQEKIEEALLMKNYLG